RRLRKKLFPYGDTYIETIFGAGYRFQRYREPRSYMNYVPELVAV
ncbi:MAG: helix-turn-helix domain-containing protein, partial [Bryobacterales bacterium]|nr:helix-turn-helix domain-containing protein [Bryobacterales bacterium]